MNKDIAVFAETTFRNKYRKFGIKTDDRRRHMYLIGKTGMGKSTVLENMVIDDIRAGRGVAVVDPHGDLAEKVIKYIPNDRINDVVYFNPADQDYPFAFNVLEQVEASQRHLVASGLIGVFKKLWADSWGPRLEYILRNTILAILDYPGSTLLGVTRMLSDKKFRKKVIETIEDPVVRAFWVNEFAGYNDKFASEAVSPIQNKVGQFLSTSLIRNIVGQVKSTIDMREIMDDGKILILNLSKGRIGEDSSALLGAMIITKIQLAAMSRVDISENERRDFYLYIDEFQNFTTDSFANILSEARKYKLNLIMAHQYIEQLGEIVRYAVFGNVGTLVVFRVGASDAEALEPEFTPTFTEEDILNIPKYEFYLKLMIDGIASEPFSARGIAPLTKEEETGNFDKIVAVGRERYAQDRISVEDKIARWYDPAFATTPTAKVANNNRVKAKVANPAVRAIPNDRKNNSSVQANHRVAKSEPVSVIDKNFAQNNQTNNAVTKKTVSVTRVKNNSAVYKYTVNCTRCNAETKVSFKPDGVRPVFCKDCLSISREERKRELEDRKIAKEKELKKLSANPPLAKTQVRSQVKQKLSVSNFSKQVKSKDIRAKEPEEMSLGQALKMNPVNFKGKEISKKKDSVKTPHSISTHEKDENLEPDDSPPVFRSAKPITQTVDVKATVKKNILSDKSIDNKQSFRENDGSELEIEQDKSVDF